MALRHRRHHQWITSWPSAARPTCLIRAGINPHSQQSENGRNFMAPVYLSRPLSHASAPNGSPDSPRKVPATGSVRIRASLEKGGVACKDKTTVAGKPGPPLAKTEVL